MTTPTLQAIDDFETCLKLKPNSDFVSMTLCAEMAEEINFESLRSPISWQCRGAGL
jgi:hypothetical protein